MSDLKPQQRRAALALSAGGSFAEVAREVGATERTVRRWSKEPAFQALLDEAGTELVRALSRRLMRLGDVALDQLEHVLLSRDSTPASLVRAATATLELALRFREAQDLERRLAELEAELQHREGDPYQ